MSIRCGVGSHSYRFVSLKPGPDPLLRAPCWWYLRKCKRCGLDWDRLVYRFPRIIRTHDWDTE